MASSKNQNELPYWLLNDLAWLSTEQSLLRDAPSSLCLIQKTCNNLIAGALHLDPEQVSLLSTRRQGALGRYFEALVQTIISLAPEVEKTHPNVVIMEGKRTCGEIDLLYKRDGIWIHLELAVKFYIGLENRIDPFQWHGPAARDTLGRKLGRLKDHQLQLPKTNAGQIALENLNIESVKSEALIMGRLFHPFTGWQQGSLVVPVIISKTHPASWWLQSQEMSHLCENLDTFWNILSKPSWLAPLEVPLRETLTGQDLLAFLRSSPLLHPIIVAALKDGIECHRGFIVPDDWLETVKNKA